MRGERQLTGLGAPFHRAVGLIRHLPDGTIWRARIAKLPGRLAASRHSQYPSLDLRHCALRWRQGGLEERDETTVLVGAAEPSGDTVGIMLVARALRAGEAAAPKRGIDLGNGGTPSRNVPAVERPKMHALAQSLADEAQPRKPGMGRFRY